MDKKQAKKLVKKLAKEKYPKMKSDDFTCEIKEFQDGDFEIKYVHNQIFSKIGILLWYHKNKKEVGTFKEGMIYKRLKLLK